MLRCIYCGFVKCLPTEAITLGISTTSFTDRRQAIYPKEMLIEPVPAAAAYSAKDRAGKIHSLGSSMEDPRIEKL